jgi:microcystin-dependent protein
MQGQAACMAGQGPGLQPYDVGETFGQENVTLSPAEMPMHNHTVSVFNQPTAANRSGIPSNGSALALPANFGPFTTANTAGGNFAPQMLGPNSGGLPHNNQQPYLALNFCICLSGDFPLRP